MFYKNARGVAAYSVASSDGSSSDSGVDVSADKK